MRDIRVATVMINAPVGRVSGNLEKMETWVTRAKGKGAGIICFPEMNITGYSIRKEIAPFAEPVPGSISEVVADMANRYSIVILAGMAEKDSKGNLSASHLVACPVKEVQVYRKLYIAPPEQDIYTAWNEIPIFDACGIRFGIQLCYDAHFPELSTYMTAKGAEVIFIPHASPRGTSEEKFHSWMRHLPARAFDNSVFIVACNQTGDNGEGLTFPGLSLVIGPTGEIINKDLSNGEGMLLTDLKEKDFAAVRNHRMRYFFPNRRPELY